MTLTAPFPYFGGKSRVAGEVWARLGDVGRYIEPFAGSLAVLLARPLPFTGLEIVNDLDGLLVNAWRAMAKDPDAVAVWADWPKTENDLHARHAWLVGHRDDITRHLEGDPDWCDPKTAGWWLWGIGLWIGGGWCSGEGPWRVDDGKLLHAGDDGQGIHRKRLHAGDDGQGIHRKRLHAGDDGRGIHRKRLEETFGLIADRLRDALVMCGDWKRVVTPTVLTSGGSSKPTGIFLDPPYADTATRTAGLYAHDSLSVAHEVREWAIANGDDPRFRIALAGYEGEHQMPSSWSVLHWKPKGGYAGQGDGGQQAARNVHRERVWFSPHCEHVGLWDQTAELGLGA